VTEDIETFRDHFLSIYQSAVSEVARRIDTEDAADPKDGRRARSAIRRSASSLFPNYAAELARREYAHRRGQAVPLFPAGPAKRELTGGDAARVCAELALRYLKARLSGDTKALAQIQGEFTASTSDPAWITTIEEYLKYFGPGGSRKQIPYIRASAVGARTIELKTNARVALVGDWGTGGQPAVQVLKHVASWKLDVLIHLGDIYYSGTPTECASNFTSLIQNVLRSGNLDLAAYTLAGNHDMYCGGIGYYDLIQHLNPEPLKQPASFFCLRSTDEKWQLLAMDTGLHDYSPIEVDEAVTFVEDDELEWHCARLKEFPGRTMLLSHHQLFSAFSPIGKADRNGQRSAVNPHLLKAFNSMTASGRISAWFWGHEHTLSIYEPFMGLERGRCLGHGAVPVSILDKIYVPVPGLGKTPTIVANTQLRQQGSVYAHGYAVLSFGADTCLAEYYQDADGRAAFIYSETIQ
jgi:hypothetical protein